MKREEVIKRIEEKIEPLLERMSLELVEIEFQHEAVGLVLRIFIDRPEGVNLQTCSQASEAISNLLDREDIIKGSYSLEVSSPGVERRISKLRDFQRFLGRKVKIKLANPIGGRRNFTGLLRKAGEDSCEIEADGQIFTFAFNDIQGANLVFTEEDFLKVSKR